MQQQRLTALVEDPALHRRVLGEYRGGYSLGLILDPADRSQPALRVRIEGNDASMIAKEVVVDGERVPVLVDTGFRGSRPLLR